MFYRTLLALVCVLGGISANAQTTESVSLSAEEGNFYQLINQFRQKLNLPVLNLQVQLESSARKHADWMASQDFLTHYGPINHLSPFQRMNLEGYVNYSSAGENIACGNAGAVETFRQWAFSPEHLDNMVSPNFHQMGIARSGTGSEVCPYYWTNDFGSFNNPNTDPAPMTDLKIITQAIVDLTGEIPSAQLPVRLPTPTPAPTAVPPPAGDPATSPVDTTSPVVPIGPMPQNAALSSPPQGFSVLQCMVPSSIGKGVFTSMNKTDSLIEVTKINNSYSMRVSYFQNNRATTFNPVLISGFQVIANPDFPILSVFSAPGVRLGGFTIQMNTKTNEAQFNSYGFSPGTSGSVLCTLKY